jgi:Leucine-rich repeat (LRR) protein
MSLIRANRQTKVGGALLLVLSGCSTGPQALVSPSTAAASQIVSRSPTHDADGGASFPLQAPRSSPGTAHTSLELVANGTRLEERVPFELKRPYPGAPARPADSFFVEAYSANAEIFPTFHPILFDSQAAGRELEPGGPIFQEGREIGWDLSGADEEALSSVVQRFRGTLKTFLVSGYTQARSAAQIEAIEALAADRVMLSLMIGPDEIDLRGLERLGDTLVALHIEVKNDLGATRVDLDQLRKLRNLQFLSITLREDCECDPQASPWLTGHGGLAALPNLKRLHLYSGSWGEEEAVDLSKLTQLRELDLSETPLTESGIARLSHLDQLETLSLNGTCANDRLAAVLSRISNLRSLTIGSFWEEGELSDRGLGSLGRLKRLRHLGIVGSPGGNVTDKGLAWLSKLTDLRELELGGLPITDDGLKRIATLGSLEALDLGITGITSAGLANLSPLKGHLERLILRNTEITDDGLASLSELKELRTLDLYGTQIGDAGLAKLAGLSELRELDLYETNVTDDGLAHLAGLAKLETLDLSGTKVTGTGFAHLSNLGSLRNLVLESSSVTDDGLDAIAQLSALWSLDFRDTGISDAGVQQLAKLKELRHLDVRDTKITEDEFLRLVRDHPILVPPSDEPGSE